MALSFFIESFMRDNMSSIIGLISTVIIMIIGYKLNVILQNSRTKKCPQIESKINDNIIHNHGEKNTKSTCSASPHHRRAARICSCSCPYNKISTSSIYNDRDRESIDDIHLLLTNELFMLISGYVLLNTYHIGLCISSDHSDIISLMTAYFMSDYQYTQIFVIKGSHKGRHPWLNKIECFNLNYKSSYNMNIYKVNDEEQTQTLSTLDHNWDSEENGVCLVPNIDVNGLISCDIQKKIEDINSRVCDGEKNKYFDMNNHRYNAIFKCGGMKALGSNLSLNSNASMIVFCKDRFKLNSGDSSDEVIGFEISLPRLPPSQTYCAQSVYSSKHGLITNCRDNAFLFDVCSYVLNENENNNDTVSWNKLCRMKYPRNWASSLCLIDSSNKLFVCSGDGSATKSVEIYNILSNEWYSMKDMNDSFLMQSGIYYDYLMERVIVGGGYKTEQMVTYYDIKRDIWINLPDTKYRHSQYPSIWCNKFVINNILYIAGNSRNDLGVIEFIDLRDKKWNLLSNDLQLNQYIETPQIFKHNNAHQISNHHRENDHHYPMQIRRTLV